MFKLLTDQAREKVSNEYALRRSAVALTGISFVLLIGIITLIPSYIVSLSHISVARSRSAVLKNSPTREGSDALLTWLALTNQKLALLSSNDSKDMPYEYFLKVIAVKPTGVSLEKFSWKKDNKIITVSVQGVANDRQSLLDFENQLNSSGDFSKTILPVSNFVKDKDINFDLSLLISQ